MVAAFTPFNHCLKIRAYRQETQINHAKFLDIQTKIPITSITDAQPPHNNSLKI